MQDNDNDNLDESTIPDISELMNELLDLGGGIQTKIDQVTVLDLVAGQAILNKNDTTAAGAISLKPHFA